MNFFSTAAATSDIGDRVNNAIGDTAQRIGNDRLKKIHSVQNKINDLQERGLLKREEFRAATRPNLQKLYLKNTRH